MVKLEKQLEEGMEKLFEEAKKLNKGILSDEFLIKYATTVNQIIIRQINIGGFIKK